jgi:hypothetical protein
MSTLKIRHKQTDVADFQELLGQYGEAELQSPLRSTVPLLAFWRDPSIALTRLSGALGETLSNPVELLFEYQVPVRGGRGKASHTDLMVRTPTQAVAIEAKYTEPAYESVSAWRRKARGGRNRDAVLEGWLKSINATLGCNLTIENAKDSTYQLIHRTASACEWSAVTRIVAYQCFDCGSAAAEEYIGQMQDLKNLIGSQTNLRFVFLDCKLRRTKHYDDLVRQWPAQDRRLEPAVRRGLREGTLITVETCSATFA